MSRRLDDLSYVFRPFAIELLARLTEAGIPVMIVDTKRTASEQAANIAAGVSWTKNSKHLTGDAIDICPYDIFQLNGPDKLKWDASDPVWNKIGAIGKKLGLRWGGDWGKNPSSKVKPDLGHFEMPPNAVLGGDTDV